MIELYFFVVILSSAITIVVLAFLVIDRASRERAWRDVAMERRRNHDERDGRQCGETGYAARVVGPDEYRLDGNDDDGRGCESYG